MSVLLSVLSLNGCGLCQRVAALSPAHQALFCTLLVSMLGGLALMAFLYVRLGAKRVPGVPGTRLHRRFWGVLWDLRAGMESGMSVWKFGMMRGLIDDHVAAQKNAGVSAPQPPKLAQWSIPFSAPFVDILTAAGVKHVLADQFDNFVKGQLLYDVFEELLGDGIFAVDGAQWRTQRKVASHLFSFSRLNDYMLEVFHEETAKLMSILKRHAEQKTEFDFQLLMLDFTFESICSIAFGVKLHQLGSSKPHPFCEAFDAVQGIIAHRALSPPILWKAKRACSIGDEATFKRHMVTINKFIYDIVRDRKKNAEEYAERNDLLSLFVADAAKKGEELTDDHLRNLVLNFLVAGRDTTATALTWLFWAFAQNPKTEDVCVAEVQSVLDPRVETNAESLKSLVQVEAAFLESVRMWPPVPVDLKQCVADSVFPCGTRIPKGTVMVYTPFLLSRLPEFYRSTTGLKHWAADCTEFKPSRWIVSDANAAAAAAAGADDHSSDSSSSSVSSRKILNPSPYDFISFNAGLRMCLGKSMAILEGKVVASAILQNFHIKVRPGFQPHERLTIVYAIEGGMPVTVEARKQAN